MKPYTTEERLHACNNLLKVLSTALRKAQRGGKDTTFLEADVAAARSRQKELLNQK